LRGINIQKNHEKLLDLRDSPWKIPIKKSWESSTTMDSWIDSTKHSWVTESLAQEITTHYASLSLELESVAIHKFWVRSGGSIDICTIHRAFWAWIKTLVLPFDRICYKRYSTLDKTNCCK